MAFADRGCTGLGGRRALWPAGDALIGVFREDGIDAAAPAAVVGFEHFLGRGASGLDDFLQRVEEMRLVGARCVAPVSRLQAGLGQGQDFMGEAAERRPLERRPERPP